MMKLDEFSSEFIKNSLVEFENYKPFPTISDRDMWNKLLNLPLNKRRKKELIPKANKILKKDWTIIPLSRYFDFIRTGDRDAFESLYMGRRQDLAVIVLAALFTGEQKYIEKSAEMLWAICEESSWAISAHVERKILNDGKTDICPSLSRPTIALFSCKTAAVLAEASYLLNEELNHLSPTILERLESEINTRIIVPFETRSDFHWLRSKNNWTPWCISSVFIAASYLVRENERLAKIFTHGLNLLQGFIDAYPPDFSCNEGPAYWGVSPGALFMIFETLYSRSSGKLNFFNYPEFHKMGKYFEHMHINGPWFFNYSDTPARIPRPVVKVYRYGERIKDNEMKNLALIAMKKWNSKNEPDPSLGLSSRCGDLLYAVRELFWIPATIKTKPLRKEKSIWYPHSQLLIARESQVPDSGFVLAVKGGHNGESHNHIDVGEFLVFADGEPIIIDPGRGEYRRQNFSDHRYNIWWNASDGHNILQFGNHKQSLGGEAKAETIDFSNEKKFVLLELDLTKTFNKDSGVVWKRKYSLNRIEKKIKIEDNFCLKNPEEIIVPLYTIRDFVLSQNSVLFIIPHKGKVLLKWNEGFIAKEEKIKDEDLYLDKFWGTKIKKILLRSIKKIHSGQLSLEFSRQ